MVDLDNNLIESSNVDYKINFLEVILHLVLNNFRVSWTLGELIAVTHVVSMP